MKQKKKELNKIERKRSVALTTENSVNFSAGKGLNLSAEKSATLGIKNSVNFSAERALISAQKRA